MPTKRQRQAERHQRERDLKNEIHKATQPLLEQIAALQSSERILTKERVALLATIDRLERKDLAFRALLTAALRISHELLDSGKP